MAGSILTCPAFSGSAETGQAAVDTALILAVDISDSVDAERYRLQMEGIARALEDQSVINAVTSGPQGGIALALVEWAENAKITIDWQIIRTAEEAKQFAARIRQLKQPHGEFTCMARMLKIVAETIVEAIPVKATRTVVDVSGDGIDNCDDAETTELQRDELVAKNVTINGLPILVKGENDTVGSGAYRAPGFGLRELSRHPDEDVTTLDKWYDAHVKGGPFGFLHAAQGYDDFGRAFRQKFVTEISVLRR